MKELKNAIIVDGVAYTINATEAKKIARLLGLGNVAQTTTTTNTVKSTPAPKKSEPKTVSKKSTRIVGSLECDGKFVRTVKGAFLSSKARYEKYVQVYMFKSVEDAKKFMDNQQSRMAK